jgi:hypothetical protein
MKIGDGLISLVNQLEDGLGEKWKVEVLVGMNLQAEGSQFCTATRDHILCFSNLPTA